jgi:predicted transcriptional regulator
MKQYEEPFITGDRLLNYLDGINNGKMFFRKTATDLKIQSDKHLKEVAESMEELGFIEITGDSRNVFEITIKGKEIVKEGGLEKFLTNQNSRERSITIKEEEEAELRKYNIKNAKRIYKTYWLTFWVAMIGGAVSLILAILKIFGK